MFAENFETQYPTFTGISLYKITFFQGYTCIQKIQITHLLCVYIHKKCTRNNSLIPTNNQLPTASIFSMQELHQSLNEYICLHFMYLNIGAMPMASALVLLPKRNGFVESNLHESKSRTCNERSVT